jgi:hypothetical protein
MDSTVETNAEYIMAKYIILMKTKTKMNGPMYKMEFPITRNKMGVSPGVSPPNDDLGV